MEGRTHICRLGNGTLTGIGYRDEILGPIVKPCAGAVGIGFLLFLSWVLPSCDENMQTVPGGCRN